jgi:flagellar basal body-associated protein FliL
MTSGVKIFLLLLALVALIVGGAVVGMWLIAHSVEPYQDPTS